MKSSVNRKKKRGEIMEELVDHLVKLLESNNEKFNFEWATAGLDRAKMEVYDKDKDIGYVLKIEPIKYDDNGNPTNI